MLSQDDRRQLELIANHFEREDPRFARAMAQGRPRRPSGDCRWPLVTAVAVAGMVFLAGLLIQAVVVMLLGAAGFGCVAVVYMFQVRRSQGRPIRRGRRPV
jgi:hypothetical protein